MGNAGSIIQGIRPVEVPNQLDMAVKGMQMRNMASEQEARNVAIEENKQNLIEKQRQVGDDTALRNAFDENTVETPDGTPAVNQQGVINSLHQSGHGQLAMKQGLAFSNANNEIVARKQQMTKNVLLKALGDPSEEAYQSALKDASGMGIDVSHWPQQRDDGMLKNALLSNLSLEERIAVQKVRNEAQDIKLRTYKEAGGPPPKNTPTGDVIFGEPGAQGKASVPGSAQAAAQGAQPSAQPAAQGKAGAPKQAQLSDKDPSDLLQNVPPEYRAKVAAEIDEAKAAATNGVEIMKSHDRAYDPRWKNLLPGTKNADVKAFEALMGPTFKITEGSARQSQMENMFKNADPDPFGDRMEAGARQKKRDATENYLTSKQSASLSKSFGIDLSKYKSTNVRAALNSVQPTNTKGASAATINIKLPDGRTGTIPHSNLSKAIEMGAEVIP